MADEKVLKVFHAARQDIEIVWHQSGTISAPDLRYASGAMVLGYGDSIAYDQLVRAHHRSSAGQDPSLYRLVAPAADRRPDALRGVRRHHLRDVFTALDADLKKRGRNDWVSEEMEVLTSPQDLRLSPRTGMERLKTRVRKPKELAVLMEVAAWREQEAQKPRRSRAAAF